jgi:hypothetical protein
MHEAFKSSLKRAFAGQTKLFGSQITLNGEECFAILEKAQFSFTPSEGGIDEDNEYTVQISKAAWTELGKPDPRRNIITVDGKKFRVRTIDDISDRPFVVITAGVDK